MRKLVRLLIIKTGKSKIKSNLKQSDDIEFNVHNLIHNSSPHVHVVYVKPMYNSLLVILTEHMFTCNKQVS